MKCSKCGVQAPLSPPNGKKLVEQECTMHRTHTTELKIGYSDSDPYGVLCPNCYQEMFKGLIKFKDRIRTETIDFKPAYFTKSAADYINQPTLKIDATELDSGKIYINQFDV